MSRNLVAVNAALAALATALVVYIASQFVARAPLPAGGRRPPQPVTSAGTVEAPRAPASAYNVVAARNLFSPTRTEATSATSVAATPLVRPNLFGVVVRDGGSIAYLEDPTTKRVAGYRVGDQILGGKVQAIRGDVVTIDAPGGAMEVRLHDPGKPRATPAAVTGMPQPGVAPALPGVIPPAAPPAAAAPSQPQVAQPPMQPAQPPQPMMPGQPPVVGVPTQPNVVNPQAVPGRRALPPNLLRRLPPGTGDAPQQ
jgi:hypothetical protein